MGNSRKLSDILRDIFGKNFNTDFDFNLDFEKDTTPEEFMCNTEYEKTEESGIDEYGNNFTKTTYMSKDGKRRYSRKVINSSPFRNDNTYMKLSNRLYTLEMDLKIAVDKQEFEKAADIRDEIANIKQQLKNKV